MMHWFAVRHLDSIRLLAEWRWLCSGQMTVIARNAFADLFVCDEKGTIFRLDAAGGKLDKVADSEAEFRALAETSEKREEWFAESEEAASVARGLMPDENQCIGFTMPLVFAESSATNTPYIVDIYDHVAFLGDIHRQIASLPNGSSVRLVVKR
jgi:hypothetical protein